MMKLPFGLPRSLLSKLPQFSDFKISNLKRYYYAARFLLKKDRWVYCASVIGAAVLFSAVSYMGYLFLRDGRSNLLDGNYSVAYSQFIGPAKKGDLQAQTVIGNLYYLGYGVKRDQFEGARWYLKAALSGHVPAQLNLAKMYWGGIGLPRNGGKAVGWYHLASRLGSETAEVHLNYIGLTNGVLPTMFKLSRSKFDNLKLVQDRYAKMGEADFLLK